jgi:hypothetical protein
MFFPYLGMCLYFVFMNVAIHLFLEELIPKTSKSKLQVIATLFTMSLLLLKFL